MHVWLTLGSCNAVAGTHSTQIYFFYPMNEMHRSIVGGDTIVEYET